MSIAIAPRTYRANFLLDPREVDVEVDDAAAKIAETLTNLGATVKETKPIGSRPLVRVTDRRMPAAIYLQFLVEGQPTLPAAIKEKYRLDRSVNRVIINIVDR